MPCIVSQGWQLEMDILDSSTARLRLRHMLRAQASASNAKELFPCGMLGPTTVTFAGGGVSAQGGPSGCRLQELLRCHRPPHVAGPGELLARFSVGCLSVPGHSCLCCLAEPLDAARLFKRAAPPCSAVLRVARWVSASLMQPLEFEAAVQHMSGRLSQPREP